jgi:hypothetical protein
MSMRPLIDSERNAATLAVVRALFDNASEVEKRFPNHTRFTPVLVDDASNTIQVAIEPPTGAAPTLEPITKLAS